MPEQRELNHLQRYLVEEAVEDYREGHITRRDALKMIAGVFGTMVAATTFLAACAPSAPVPGAGVQGGAAEVTSPTSSTAAPAASAPSPSPAAPTAETAALAATPTAAQAAQITAIATQAVITTTATIPLTPPPIGAVALRVSADDPAIQAADIQFPAQGATLLGYQARPRGDGSFPPVLVCHENRGLTDHIKDVTRRVAKAGYVGLAVDLLSRQGGTAKIADQNTIPGLLGNTPPAQMVQDFQSGLAYLQGLPYVIKDRPGMVGFCFGGGITWLCAEGIPALRAVVPYYGPIPPLADVPKIQAAVLAMYGGNDQRIDAGIPAIEGAMQQNHKIYEKMIYPGANHAFNNDTGPSFNAQAAIDAWGKTIAWFKKYLKG